MKAQTVERILITNDAWIVKRHVFRQFLAGLNMTELLDVAEDIKMALDYEANNQQQIQEAIRLMQRAVS